MSQATTPASAPTDSQPFRDSQYLLDRVGHTYGPASLGFASGATTGSVESEAGITPEELAQLPHPDWVPADIREFCRLRNGFTIFWEVTNHPDFAGFCLDGRIVVEPLQSMLRDWEGEMYFADAPPDDPMRDFKVVDYCADEAVVGFFHAADRPAGLHYYDLEDTYALEVDFSGYLALLTYTLGCAGWHALLLALEAPTPETRPFRPTQRAGQHVLARLQAAVPGFDLDAFVACYDRVRLPAA